MPTERTKALADALCEEISSGSSVKQACESQGLDRREFYRWLNSDEEFSTSIARARERQQESLVEEMREIADAATAADWQVARLRIWQRQWEAAKLAPRKYGERVHNEHSGMDGGPVQIIVHRGHKPPHAKG